MTVSIGANVSFLCRHNSSDPRKHPNVTWLYNSKNNRLHDQNIGKGKGPKGELNISLVNKSHVGLYRCEVSAGKEVWRSCGTYLRVLGEWQS